MFEIINYSNVITKEEIENCCELLDKEHKSLNAKIIIFKSKWQLLFKYLLLSNEINGLKFNSLKSIFKKQTLGTYLYINYRLTGEIENVIYIYPFNLKKSSKLKTKLQTIITLFHEIRHLYQSKNNPDFFSEERSNNLSVGDKLYDEQPLEKDAINFSKQFIVQNKNEIKKIIKGG